MTTKYETALNEFREASAELRRAFGAVSETREKQIIANRCHAVASETYTAAQARLERADAALQAVQPEAPAPADIDVTGRPAERVAQANAAMSNGAIDADATGLGIG